MLATSVPVQPAQSKNKTTKLDNLDLTAWDPIQKDLGAPAAKEEEKARILASVNEVIALAQQNLADRIQKNHLSALLYLLKARPNGKPIFILNIAAALSSFYIQYNKYKNNLTDEELAYLNQATNAYFHDLKLSSSSQQPGSKESDKAAITAATSSFETTIKPLMVKQIFSALSDIQHFLRNRSPVSNAIMALRHYLLSAHRTSDEHAYDLAQQFVVDLESFIPAHQDIARINHFIESEKQSPFRDPSLTVHQQEIRTQIIIKAATQLRSVLQYKLNNSPTCRVYAGEYLSPISNLKGEPAKRQYEEDVQVEGLAGVQFKEQTYSQDLDAAITAIRQNSGAEKSDMREQQLRNWIRTEVHSNNRPAHDDATAFVQARITLPLVELKPPREYRTVAQKTVLAYDERTKAVVLRVKRCIAFVEQGTEKRSTEPFDAIETIELRPFFNREDHIVANQVESYYQVNQSAFAKGISETIFPKQLSLGWGPNSQQMERVSDEVANLLKLYGIINYNAVQAIAAYKASAIDNKRQVFHDLLGLHLQAITKDIEHFEQRVLYWGLIDTALTKETGIATQLITCARQCREKLNALATTLQQLKKAVDSNPQKPDRLIVLAQTILLQLQSLTRTVEEKNALEAKAIERLGKHIRLSSQQDSQYRQNPQKFLSLVWLEHPAIAAFTKAILKQKPLNNNEQLALTTVKAEIATYSSEQLIANAFWRTTKGGADFSQFNFDRDYHILNIWAGQARLMSAKTGGNDVLANLYASQYSQLSPSQQTYLDELAFNNTDKVYRTKPPSETWNAVEADSHFLQNLLNAHSTHNDLITIACKVYKNYRSMTKEEQQRLNNCVLASGKNNVGLAALAAANDIWHETKGGTQWNGQRSLAKDLAAMTLWDKQNRLTIEVVKNYFKLRYVSLNQIEQRQLLEWVTIGYRPSIFNEKSTNALLLLAAKCKESKSTFGQKWSECGFWTALFGTPSNIYLQSFNKRNSADQLNYEALLCGAIPVAAQPQPAAKNSPQIMGQQLAPEQCIVELLKGNKQAPTIADLKLTLLDDKADAEPTPEHRTVAASAAAAAVRQKVESDVKDLDDDGISDDDITVTKGKGLNASIGVSADAKLTSKNDPTSLVLPAPRLGVAC